MKRTNLFRKAAALCCIAVVMLFAAIPASAAGFNDSTLYTGTINLIKDLMGWAMVLCPMFGGLAAVYFMIRRSMADEQEGKMWTNRIVIAIVCGVGGSLVSGLISIVTSYFVAA